MAKTDEEYDDLKAEKDAIAEEVVYQKDRSTRVDAIIFRLIAVLPKVSVVVNGVTVPAVLHSDLMNAVYDPVDGLDTIPPPV